MELGITSEANKQDLVEELIDQNSQLRMEIASSKAVLKALSNEFVLLQKMKNSQNIPPDVWEKLSKLDIR